MRRFVAWSVLVVALGGALASGQEGEFPEWLVRWEPIAENPLFEGTGGGDWNAKIRERGWILREDDGTYRLWYTGYNDEKSPIKFLGHATSPDGIRWTRDPRNPIYTGSWVEDMCVLKQDGTYFMFAEGERDIAHMLTSPDGIAWERVGPLDVRLSDGTPIPPGPYGTPTVLIKDGLWLLFYERGDQGIWLATSPDLTVWTNVQDDPVIPLGPDDYDSTAVALNQIIEHEGIYYGIYHANAHRPWRDWTTCVARSTDLIRWEKSPSNPIVEDNRSSGLIIDTPEGRKVLYTMHPDVRRFEYPGSEDEPEAP